MLNQLLRFTLVSSALLWLRPRWRGLVALTASVLLIHILHGEYLGYVELSGNSDFLVWSYVLKWIALVISVATYVLLAVYGLKPGPRPNVKPAGKADSERLRSEFPAPEAVETSGSSERRDDGFDFLRQKKHLENRADKLIAGKRR